jgi:hypothetical protein
MAFWKRDGADWYVSREDLERVIQESGNSDDVIRRKLQRPAL